MSKTLRLATVTLILFAANAIAQRPRTTTQDSTQPATSMPAPPMAPSTVKAKYEGGVFGYNKRQDGTLNFDDSNHRLLFRDSKGKELLFIPYSSLTGAYGDTKRVQPAAATVASHIPTIFAMPANY